MSFPTSPTNLQIPNLPRLRLTKAKLKRFFVAVKVLVAHCQGQRQFQLCQPRATTSGGTSKQLGATQRQIHTAKQNNLDYIKNLPTIMVTQQNLPIQGHSMLHCNTAFSKPKLGVRAIIHQSGYPMFFSIEKHIRKVCLIEFTYV